MNDLVFEQHKGKTIRFTITDTTFLAKLRELAHNPDPQANGGFQTTLNAQENPMTQAPHDKNSSGVRRKHD